MDTRWRRLLWGRPERRRRRWLRFVGGYAVVAALATGYRLLAPLPGVAPVVYEDPLLTALFLGPLVVSAVCALVGGGLVLGLTTGATPALAYGLVLFGTVFATTGGVAGLSELLFYTGASAAVGAVAGAVGFAVGALLRRYAGLGGAANGG
jgi:hypothetical protein